METILGIRVNRESGKKGWLARNKRIISFESPRELALLLYVHLSLPFYSPAIIYFSPLSLSLSHLCLRNCSTDQNEQILSLSLNQIHHIEA